MSMRVNYELSQPSTLKAQHPLSADLIRLAEMYSKLSLKDPAAIIDTSHADSNKKFKEQIRIVREVLHSCCSALPTNASNEVI